MNSINKQNIRKMTVGLTYDLRSEYLKMGYSMEETAEFDSEDTILAIENTLHDIGFRTDRIGSAMQLIDRLCQGDRWNLVFNIAEGMYGIGREAQVPAILDVYNIPYTFSDPLVLALSLHKGMTKRVIRDLGIPTPNFSILYDLEDIHKISLAYPLFAKPIAEGTGKGITSDSQIENQDKLLKVCRDLFDKFNQPILIEEFLPGREFTVGIIGTGKNSEVLGKVMEVNFLNEAKNGIYSYYNKANYEETINYNLISSEIAEEIQTIALAAWRGLNCRDAGRIDIRCDKYGKPYFLEVNPLAGLNPNHSDLPIICRLSQIPYKTLINKIINSALLRTFN